MELFVCKYVTVGFHLSSLQTSLYQLIIMDTATFLLYVQQPLIL